MQSKMERQSVSDEVSDREIEKYSNRTIPFVELIRELLNWSKNYLQIHCKTSSSVCTCI